MDQQETFNWLVEEKSKLEQEVYRLNERMKGMRDALDAATQARDDYQRKYLDALLKWAQESTKEQRERLRRSELIPTEIWNLVLD